MKRALKGFLNRSIQTGRLEIVDPDGERHVFGDGRGPPIRIRITSTRAELGLILNPHLKLGETFTDGELIVEEGSIYGLLELLFNNVATTHPTWTALAVTAWR